MQCQEKGRIRFMPTPKRPTRETAKKAAKKAAGHGHHQQREANDLRRAYEHMGRVAVLRQASQMPETDTMTTLTRLAQQSIKDGQNKDAADLLRAAEHLSFAVLAGEGRDVARVSAELKESIAEQFDESMRRADEHWNEEGEHSASIGEIYESSRKNASKAFEAEFYHQALEFARGAEALAHVKEHGLLKLESGHKKLHLKSA